MENQIVIIDDEIILRTLIKEWLNENGFKNIITYESPVNALKEIEEGKIQPALIITDYEMPDMKGSEFVDKIKFLYPKIPAVIVTGNTEAKAELSGKYKVLLKARLDFLQTLTQYVKDTLTKGVGHDTV
ncbi:MAG: response regulator [bacterium]